MQWLTGTDNLGVAAEQSCLFNSSLVQEDDSSIVSMNILSACAKTEGMPVSNASNRSDSAASPLNLSRLSTK